MNIAIVVSEFNDNVTSRMHKVALEKARELKLNVKYECKVPVSYTHLTLPTKA